MDDVGPDDQCLQCSGTSGGPYDDMTSSTTPTRLARYGVPFPRPPAKPLLLVWGGTCADDSVRMVHLWDTLQQTWWCSVTPPHRPDDRRDAAPRWRPFSYPYLYVATQGDAIIGYQQQQQVLPLADVHRIDRSVAIDSHSHSHTHDGTTRIDNNNEWHIDNE